MRPITAEHMTPASIIAAFEAHPGVKPILSYDRDDLEEGIEALVEQEVAAALEQASLNHVCGPVPQPYLPAQMEELRGVLEKLRNAVADIEIGHGPAGVSEAGQQIGASGLRDTKALLDRALRLCPIQFDDNHAGSVPRVGLTVMEADDDDE